MTSIYSNKKGGWQLRLDWDQKSQNVAGNSSVVEARLFLIADGGWNISSSAFTGYININGNTKTISANPSNGGGTTVALGTHTVTIAHNADGTKSFSIGFSYNLGIYSGSYGGTVGWLEGSGSGSLTTIPRAYTFTVKTASPVIGSAITINVANNGSGMKAWAYIAFGTKYLSRGEVAVGKDVTITAPLAEMAAEIPNAKLGLGSIYIETWAPDNVTKIGSNRVATTFTLPNSVGVALGNVTSAEQNSKVSTMLGTAGTYLEGNSKIKFTIPTTLQYGATLVKTEIVAGGHSFLTDTIDLASYSVGTGTIEFTVNVTDSRGYTASKKVTYPVIAYSPPQILTLSIARGTGTKATITKSGKVSSVKIGTTEKNTYTAVTKYKVTGTTTWGTAKTEENVFASLNLEGFDVTKSYDIQVTLTDKLNSITVSTFLTTTSVVLHYHGRDKLGVGKMWERGTMDVGGDVYSNGRILRPLGMAYFTNDTTASYTTVTPVNLGTIATIPGTTEVSAGVNSITINKTGIYEIMCQAGVYMPSGYASLIININGSDLLRRAYATQNNQIYLHVTKQLNAGDTVQFRNINAAQKVDYYYLDGFIKYLGG